MAAKRVVLPTDSNEVLLKFGTQEVRLTNLRKPFWKKLGITKRDLLQYYADVSPWLLPHVADRAMVMKRYPNGAEGEFFFMKRAPEPRPEWIEICAIEHGSAGVVNFPIVQDLPSLLWLINLGCIDLNPWYARCDDTDRPDYLHFDLDPGPGADFARIREVALRVRDILGDAEDARRIRRPPARAAFTSTSRSCAGRCRKRSGRLRRRSPSSSSAAIPKSSPPSIARPSVRTDACSSTTTRTPGGGRWRRSTPSARRRSRACRRRVTWEEVEEGVSIEDFRIDNAVARLKEVGDLWKPVVGKKRVDLMKTLGAL